MDSEFRAKAFTRRNFIERLGSIGGVTLAMAGMSALGLGIASAQAAPPNLNGGRGGKKVIITQPFLLEEAIAGRNGTHMVP